MNSNRNVLSNPVSQSALSSTLLVCSAVWLAGVCEYYSTSAFKKDWLATPLFWMLIVTLMPAICFSIVLVLADQRKHSRFSRLDRCAFAAASLPITLGTVLALWAVKGLLSMSGVSF